MEAPNPIPASKAGMNNPRTINAWAIFDWANSAYALVITVAIFPGYFLELTNDTVTVMGLKMSDSTLYAWSIALAYLIIAAISPILSGIADFGGRKKVFLRFFTTLGALACISLLFFTGMPTLWVGLVGFILATIGFAGGVVFYNSFLPLIATEDRYDEEVSSHATQADIIIHKTYIPSIETFPCLPCISPSSERPAPFYCLDPAMKIILLIRSLINDG